MPIAAHEYHFRNTAISAGGMLYEYFSVIDSRLADYEILLREASTLSPFPYHLDLDYGIVQIVLLMIVREKDKEVDNSNEDTQSNTNPVW